MTDKPVDPKPTGLYDDRAELWYVATGIVNSHETGEDLKQLALGIREQLRLEARVNELTELFYHVKAERDKFIHDAASRVKYEETYAELASVGHKEHPPEGTPDGLRTIISTIEQYVIPEMPANENGQVTFIRAVFDSVVLECKAAIARWETERETAAANEKSIFAIPAICRGEPVPCAMHVSEPINELRRELATANATIARLTEERDRLNRRVQELEADNAKMKESDEDRYPSMCRYAANLRAEIDRLRAVLKPFAERAAYYEQRTSDNEDDSVGCVTLGDLRRAALALVKGGGK